MNCSRCAVTGALLAFGVASVASSILFALPIWVSSLLILVAVVFCIGAVLVWTPCGKDRAEWLRLSMGVFLAALLGFVASSVLTSREEDRARAAALVEETRARSAALQSVREAAVLETEEVKRRLIETSADAWNVTPVGSEDSVRLAGLTYFSSGGFREAAAAGGFSSELRSKLLALANNIEMFNIIVRFAIDVGKSALQVPGLASLLRSARENLDRGRVKLLTQSEELLDLLNGTEPSE